METEELKKLVRVIPINKDSTNVLFINERSMTLDNMTKLANLLSKKHGADFGAICSINGFPEEAVKLISIKDLEK